MMDKKPIAVSRRSSRLLCPSHAKLSGLVTGSRINCQPPCELASLNSARSQMLLQVVLPIPFGTRATTIQIESCHPVFGIRVTSQVRLGQHVERCDSAGAAETMCHWFAQHLQSQVTDNLVADRFDEREVLQLFAVTVKRIDNPLGASPKDRRRGSFGEWGRAHKECLANCIDGHGFCEHPILAFA